MELIFATNNSNKLHEVREKLKLIHSNIQIKSLAEIGFFDEIPETGTTFHANALQKAQTVYDFCRRRGVLHTPPSNDCQNERMQYARTVNCFADDSGLEIDALNGAPGVYSAMYAEMERGKGGARPALTFDDNINLVLQKLHGKTNRRANFKTVIALILKGTDYKSAPAIHYFEGRVDGEILTEKRGTEGFGYDPIFRPDGYKETFAELPLDEKNRISHRGRAVDSLVAFLNHLHTT